MPVYEYRCEACGGGVELLQRVGEGPPADGCPVCGGALRRRWSRVAVRYNSWGFSATDSLVSRPGERDFRSLRERAERISDEA